MDVCISVRHIQVMPPKPRTHRGYLLVGGGFLVAAETKDGLKAAMGVRRRLKRKANSSRYT